MCLESVLPSLESPVPSDWITVEDDFALFYSVHQVGKLLNVSKLSLEQSWILRREEHVSLSLSLSPTPLSSLLLCDMRLRHYAS